MRLQQPDLRMQPTGPAKSKSAVCVPAIARSQCVNFQPLLKMNGPQGGDGIGLAKNSIGHMSVGMRGAGISARLTTDKTRRELITGQLDPRSNGLDKNPFIFSLIINASWDIFAGADFLGDAFRSTDNGDRWTVIRNALTTFNGINALTVSWNRAVFAGNLRRWGFSFCR